MKPGWVQTILRMLLELEFVVFGISSKVQGMCSEKEKELRPYLGKYPRLFFTPSPAPRLSEWEGVLETNPLTLFWKYCPMWLDMKKKLET